MQIGQINSDPSNLIFRADFGEKRKWHPTGELKPELRASSVC